MIAKIQKIIREIFFDPMPLSEFSDYDDYWEQRGKQEPKYRFRWVANHLPETGRVLDIGCGDGEFLSFLRDVKPSLHATGLDSSSSAIRKLESKGLQGHQIGDLNQPDLEPFKKVDFIVAMEIIEHLTEPELLMREFLKTDAHTFYITIPNMGFIVNRLRLALGGKTPVTAIVYHMKEHLRFWTVRDFYYWADHLGFRVVQHKGQNGFFGIWRFLPALFARQMIYVLERKES